MEKTFMNRDAERHLKGSINRCSCKNAASLIGAAADVVGAIAKLYALYLGGEYPEFWDKAPIEAEEYGCELVSYKGKLMKMICCGYVYDADGNLMSSLDGFEEEAVSSSPSREEKQHSYKNHIEDDDEPTEDVIEAINAELWSVFGV